MVTQQFQLRDDEIYKQDYVVKVPHVIYKDTENQHPITTFFRQGIIPLVVLLIAPILILAYLTADGIQVTHGIWIFICLSSLVSSILAFVIITSMNGN